VLAGGAREGNVLPGGTATAYVRGSDEASPAPEAHAATVAPAITVQLESIRHARALVASGDARAALVALDAYERRHPHGIFEEEAMALRVRALRIGGDAAGADRERTNLQSRFPKSVHLAAMGN
jgi:Tfp pilus assembly protein PilF